MKRVRADDQAIVLELSRRERDALVEILQGYPAVPPAHHAVTRELKDAQTTEYQRLLDEALAEQRAANKRHVDAWLAAPQRFQKSRAGYRFKLARADSEWLLQVLNDVRVGNWLLLGSPEAGSLNPFKTAPRLFRTWMTMEMSGYFQMNILHALEAR